MFEELKFNAKKRRKYLHISTTAKKRKTTKKMAYKSNKTPLAMNKFLSHKILNIYGMHEHEQNQYKNTDPIFLIFLMLNFSHYLHKKNVFTYLTEYIKCEMVGNEL